MNKEAAKKLTLEVLPKIEKEYVDAIAKCLEKLITVSAIGGEFNSRVSFRTIKDSIFTFGVLSDQKIKEITEKWLKDRDYQFEIVGESINIDWSK